MIKVCSSEPNFKYVLAALVVWGNLSAAINQIIASTTLNVVCVVATTDGVFACIAVDKKSSFVLSLQRQQATRDQRLGVNGFIRFCPVDPSKMVLIGNLGAPFGLVGVFTLCILFRTHFVHINSKSEIAVKSNFVFLDIRIPLALAIGIDVIPNLNVNPFNVFDISQHSVAAHYLAGELASECNCLFGACNCLAVHGHHGHTCSKFLGAYIHIQVV